jgi:hypothetical protein
MREDKYRKQRITKNSKKYFTKNENVSPQKAQKMENKTFVGFAAIDMSDGICWKFRIAKIEPTFTAEALAIGETLEIVGKKKTRSKISRFSWTRKAC